MGCHKGKTAEDMNEKVVTVIKVDASQKKETVKIKYHIFFVSEISKCISNEWLLRERL